MPQTKINKQTWKCIISEEAGFYHDCEKSQVGCCSPELFLRNCLSSELLTTSAVSKRRSLKQPHCQEFCHSLLGHSKRGSQHEEASTDGELRLECLNPRDLGDMGQNIYCYRLGLMETPQIVLKVGKSQGLV